MVDRPKIAIIGAGIGGLTTAVGLQKHGFDVTIYEQSPELTEIGAGITISVNAGRVFNALGLQDQLEALGPATPHLGALDYRTGERLSYEARDNEDYYARYGTATRVVHRADLHAMLTQAFDAETGSLRLSHRLNEISQNADDVRLEFGKDATANHDVVIACDGLKSIVRQTLFSPDPAEFTGFVAWRGLVDRARVPKINLDPHFATYSSQDKFFARYPVRHGKLINYVAIARKLDFRSENWNESAEVSEVAGEFEGWYEDVLKIIHATPDNRCMRWALYGRQPLASWVQGRVCLLGDAAHPMTPFFGMGAAMAIEDAYVLARCFEAESTDWHAALQKYQSARLDRGNQMQKISLDRAAVYMNKDKSSRAKSPSAGLPRTIEYDPVTVAI